MAFASAQSEAGMSSYPLRHLFGSSSAPVRLGQKKSRTIAEEEPKHIRPESEPGMSAYHWLDKDGLP